MKSLSQFYFTIRFFLLLAALAVIWVLLYVIDMSMFWGYVCSAVVATVLTAEAIYLFFGNSLISGKRILPARFSNGDDNVYHIIIENLTGRKVFITLIDEIPSQFQRRDLRQDFTLNEREIKTAEFTMRPVQRGEYQFGLTRIFLHSPLRIFRRRFSFGQEEVVKVYPSFLHLKKYELTAVNDRVLLSGMKKVRRIGHSMEFEQIKDYVTGDDLRSINWKASARRNKLMVNHYTDEISQQVYSVIDCGRVMKIPFNRMRLLDYAVNASLMISDIAMLKQDRAGIALVKERKTSIITAENSRKHLQDINDLLYNLTTEFGESDFESFSAYFLTKVRQRSLVLLYTNFETTSSLFRQIPYIRRLAQYHLVTVIFFQDTETGKVLNDSAFSLEDLLLKDTILRFSAEKLRVVKELELRGIPAVLTTPEALNTDVLSKYIEFKKRGLI
ncbi:MAG: DUF58 domain-containing protein [Ignavibacteriales bacterium]|nr:MAG: DUF58 domain-containing protein [Ignavibacteriales bacterium]